MNEIIYTKKNGSIKYYATYKSAWNACIRLNDKTDKGMWFYESDATGYWYLFFDADFVEAN